MDGRPPMPTTPSSTPRRAPSSTTCTSSPSKTSSSSTGCSRTKSCCGRESSSSGRGRWRGERSSSATVRDIIHAPLSTHLIPQLLSPSYFLLPEAPRCVVPHPPEVLVPKRVLLHRPGHTRSAPSLTSSPPPPHPPLHSVRRATQRTLHVRISHSLRRSQNGRRTRTRTRTACSSRRSRRRWSA